jgi:DNA-binding beta-propeller fold protein YncE
MFDAGWASHMDMLHNSPLSAGIAWEKDNIYWVLDGYHQSLTRYDFKEDHGPGGEDHSDGRVYRYVQDEVAYVEGVSSHLVYDTRTDFLYVADTGNNRIAVLDVDSGTEGDNLQKWEPRTTHYEMLEADMWTLVEGSDFGMEAPSGIELIDGTLFVTDNATSEIIAFSLDGEEIDRLDTELDAGSLMGIFAASVDDLWIVDALENRVFRIQSK